MGKARTAAAVVVSVAALAGCWPAPGQGPDRQANNPAETAISTATVATLAPVWDVATGTGAVGPPVVSPDGVHVRAGVVLHTLATGDGSTRWTLPADPSQPTWFDMSDPVIRDRQVGVGYGFGNLGGHWQAGWFDAATGAAGPPLPGGLIESVRGGTAVQSSYAFGSGTPVLISIRLVTFDGQGPGWSGTFDFRDFGAGGSAPAATLGRDGVYVSGHGVLGRTAEGNPNFGEGVRKFTLTTPPSCDNPQSPLGVVCPAWSRVLDGTVVAPPVLGDGVLYVGTSAGTLYALSTSTGDTRWSAAVGAAVQHPPAVARGHVYVPTADGDLVVLPAGGCGAATCGPEWVAPTGSRVSAQPAVGGDVVVTGSADGSVRAFAADGCGAATCTSLWDDNAGSTVTGAPAIAVGRLYVGTQDGHVVAYAPRPST